MCHNSNTGDREPGKTGGQSRQTGTRDGDGDGDVGVTADVKMGELELAALRCALVMDGTSRESMTSPGSVRRGQISLPGGPSQLSLAIEGHGRLQEA